MTINAISTDKAPKAIGPYSQAIRAGDLVFCSGQIPLDPQSGQLVSGDIRTQTKRVLDNLESVLKAAGSDLKSVVKTTIYLQDLNDFAAVNETYATYFQPPYPARVTIQAARLPLGSQVEIDAVAKVLL